MNLVSRNEVTFDNEFDLSRDDLSNIKIKENYNRDKCLIWSVEDSSICFNTFILVKNSRSKTICNIGFFKSSETGLYIPRLTFKRVFLDGSEQISKSDRNVSIPFNDSKSAQEFWKLIGFLYSYKELVDIGEFKQSFKVVAKDSYFLEFKSKDDKQKIEDLKELINIAELSTSDIKTLTFHSRKKNLEAFLYLLKNKELDSGQDSQSYYREKYLIRSGEEYLWHHFLANNEWILA